MAGRSMRKVCGGAAATELEAQQFFFGLLGVRRSELPLFGGVACQARKVLARASSPESRSDHVACAIDAYTNGNFDDAANCRARPMRNFRNFFM